MATSLTHLGTVDAGFGMAGIIVVDVVMVSISMAASACHISLARPRASSFTINLNQTCQK
jgi:hypothetical protein